MAARSQGSEAGNQWSAYEWKSMAYNPLRFTISSSGALRPVMRNFEQTEDFIFAQAQSRRRLVLRDQFVEQSPLAIEHLGDPALDRLTGNEPRDENRLLLADTMRPVDCLIFDRRIPPAVKQ